MTSSIKLLKAILIVLLGVISGISIQGQPSLVSFDGQSIQVSTDEGMVVEKVLEVEGGAEIMPSNIIQLSDLNYSITGLLPGTIYKVDFSSGEERYYATRSSSSGEMRVYFNNDINTAYSDGSTASGTSIGILERDLINLIDDAQFTIDFCAYNTSRTSIVNALRDAYARGVQVRVIADDETRNSGWEDNPPFPVVKGNAGDDLMHNKFIIVDADDMMDSWVVTGAMNFTNNQMETDPNHQIWIQDRSLSQAYTLEFEEMWGSNGPAPNLSAARYGSEKNDNTPHRFEIAGKMVELYFSPSDNTAFHIGEAIRSSDVDVNCALLLFTHFDLRDRIIERHEAGSRIRIIIENTSSSGSVLADLNSVGIVVQDHPPSQIFHHKYAIIDEGTNSDPTVVTGSHNWTFSADNFNDENTLIIHDQSIANIFKQEFRRWWEQLSTSTSDIPGKKEIEVFPNPFQHEVYIHSEVKMDKVSLTDLSGNSILEKVNCGFECKLNLHFLQNGIYLLRINDFYYKRIVKI